MAIASAIESKLVGRHGGDRKSDQEANVSPLKGKSHEIAAAAVGMGKDKGLIWNIAQIYPMLKRVKQQRLRG